MTDRVFKTTKWIHERCENPKCLRTVVGHYTTLPQKTCPMCGKMMKVIPLTTDEKKSVRLTGYP